MPVSRLVVSTLGDATVANFRESSILDGAAVQAIAKELYALVDEQARRKIILDMSAVQFLSSSMIGAILSLHKKARAIQGHIVVCGLRPRIREIFQVMRLEKVLKLVDTEKEALKWLGSRPT